MKISTVVLIALILNLLTTAAFADSNGPRKIERAFYNLIQDFRASCATDCKAPYKMKVIFDLAGSVSEANENLRLQLLQVAVDQAQVWGDTILEGDYYSEGHTRLDSVAVLFQEERLIGYRIVYSERAWFIADCDFDGADDRTLTGCSEGRIHEATFVSADFKNYFRDENEFADFKNNL